MHESNPLLEALTPRQRRVLDFIEAFIRDHEMPPTRAEIADGLGFKSVNAAVDHLKNLQRKGYIELMGGSSRGIRLLTAGVSDKALDEEQGLPLVGRVAAGDPILAQQNIEDYIGVSSAMFSPAADYFLKVRGESMRDAGILNGDLLAVHRVAVAENGQIVVARLEEEVTVKRFKQQGSQVWLLPENPDFEPIKVDLREPGFSIEGRAVGVIRQSGL